MAYPEWVEKQRRPGTHIHCIRGKYYLYEVTSVYDKEKKRARAITKGYLGRITEEGLIPPRKKPNEEESKYSVKEYGASSVLLEMGANIHAKLKEVFPNRFLVEIREEDGSRKKVSIEVRGSDYKHIANDILNNHVIPANKVNKLSKQINNSYCRKTSWLYKKRKDNIDKFYYMKVKGRRLYFNIARHKTQSNGKIKYVYRIHSIKKNCK